MSNPPCDTNNSDLYTFWAAIAGGVLSSVGGFIAVVIRSRMDKKTEIEYIKTALIDELTEICGIVNRLQETKQRTGIIPNSYYNDLKDMNEAFYTHKLRIFLIGHDDLRRGVVKFYKDLVVVVQESINKVGTLGKEETTATNDQISTQLSNLKSEADKLIRQLKAYKYKVFIIY